jgi:hypothetical protein
MLNSSANIVKSNTLAIMNSQETHMDLVDIGRMELIWRGGFDFYQTEDKTEIEDA